MVTLSFQGSQVTASNLQQIASGVRNVIGMGFDPYNGNLYFADNAIDGPPGAGNEVDPTPPQADELDEISSADLGTSVINFGYPNCYIQYITGTPVGSGCVQPLVAFQPIGGARTQGPYQLAFAPPDFPAGYNNGIYVSFAGESGGSFTGVLNDDDGVDYYSFDTGQYTQFIAPGEAGNGGTLGLLATGNTLYLADWNNGNIEAITAATPEPATLLLLLAGLAGVRLRRRG
jgi:glucose/arabinose dehydrogenase